MNVITGNKLSMEKTATNVDDKGCVLNHPTEQLIAGLPYCFSNLFDKCESSIQLQGRSTSPLEIVPNN